MQEFKKFCSKNEGKYKDYDLIRKFNENHGYELILEFIDSYNDLINEIRAIQEVINILNDWKKESFFELNETTYEIDFFRCHRSIRDNLPTKVTLPKAKQMLKESLIRYEALNSIFKGIKDVFGKDDDKYLDEYFNYYQIDGREM
ncbi:hypothetical protein [Clostridium chromiireducens]|uniref:Uncharacterized protein n=1 Tax=Clostridium chromiireducens TaxID=225345 RepID=A0A1V4IWC2_9CLOT|nr:hypothetical protein [Clostridium chromiireducens]OPJ63717.1 hypothetical protein CLCHR_15320 [Clostridium chromiireducens]